MEARPSKITEFFDGTKQMMVPLFQRSYEASIHIWMPSSSASLAPEFELGMFVR